jgi:putative membrane protein
MTDKNYNKILLLIFFTSLALSAIKPHDYFTWFLETAPAIIGLVIIWYIKKYHGFEFSRPLVALLLVHSVILMVGGHWTYAEVPLFNWLRDIGIFSRNNYDKVGHFMQGFVPVLVAREVLLQKTPLTKLSWVNFLSISVVLAASAFYELIEWWVSLLSGSAGDSFLGTQGYVWDTQSDMLFCLIGAITGIILFRKMYRQKLEFIASS